MFSFTSVKFCKTKQCRKTIRSSSLFKCFNYVNVAPKYASRVGGIVVSIAAFQAVDPGSIPGQRRIFFSFLFFFFLEQHPHSMDCSSHEEFPRV